MVHIVNSSQQITHAVLAPAGIHSRVVMMAFDVAGGLGSSQFNVTAVVGQQLRLFQVQLWLISKTSGTPVDTTFKISTATTPPASEVDVSRNWESVIDMDFVGKPFMVGFGELLHFKWDMNRIYMGGPRRFGLVVSNLSVPQIRALIAFTISEG